MSLNHLIPIAIFIIFFIHILLVRACNLFKKAGTRQKAVIASFFIGLMLLSVFFFSWCNATKPREYPQILLSGFYLLSVYALSSYVYFHLFNLSETGRRIRILSEINKMGPLKECEIAEKYSCQDMISIRLKRLAAIGGLRLVNGRYFTGNKILLLSAKFVFGFRKVLFPRDP